MDFSIMLWGDISLTPGAADYYEKVIALVRHADELGFAGVWLPERHFHPWGGFHPNPAVLAAALAPLTQKIRLRAGSLVLPLHNPIRVAEDWSVVDNLSHGRVEMAIATGWKDDDFTIAPERFLDRKAAVWDSIDIVRRLWRGEAHAAINGRGAPIDVTTYPRPLQAELPIWITSSGSMRTVSDAGGSGFNLLTHLLGQTYDDVKVKIGQHRAHRRRSGFSADGAVALMVHAFVGDEAHAVKDIVRTPLSAYLLNSADLMIAPSQRTEWNQLDAVDRAELSQVAFERYYETSSLLGTPAKCRAIISQIAEIGVTDICCLIDFGLPQDLVRRSLDHLAELRDGEMRRR